MQGDRLVVTLAGVDERNAAQALTGSTVLLSRAAFPKVAKGEFYWVDLIGCDVVNRQGEPLGQVVGLIDTGVHSVLRVAPGDAPTSHEAERLIPFVDAYVDKTDLKLRRIDVDWGLDF